ncbi:hypothetical protein [uncultured Gimesia sp.]|uniref:hypothetical protein n=1 Tax=uncultured Gimesia sp. TaxID=1678688 RepID=UPI0026154DA9|nr:hypothetical protein [uncultured Gimesia sp.]
MNENNGSKFVRFLFCGIAFLLVAYILSIGPVCASLHTTEGMPPEYVGPVTSFYAPLDWVMQRSYFAERLAVKYTKACGSPFYN